ncbi:MAG: dehydrogenase [Planctomycetia bacterium]|nr:dehydrogenase [Planctomycetia bacterium]
MTASHQATSRFRLGQTADFFTDSGEPRYRDMGSGVAEHYAGIELSRLERHEPEVQAEQLRGLHGVVVLTPRITARSLMLADELLVVARFGVGYDSVDVAACTNRDVALTITTGAVDRPVAEATIAWMLALTHHVKAKDRLVREARWNERSHYMGSELRDRTLGIVGFGGIGRKVLELLRGFGMRPPLVFDPHVDERAISEFGARPASLRQMLTEADFVSLHCPLTESTRGLIGSAELALMKPNAYLINTARGGIVDEEALYQALVAKRIAGAALDCFDGEPLTMPPRFAEFENVLLAPHAIAWTDELFRDIGRTAFGGVVELIEGRRPRGVVNPEVFERPTFQAKWHKLQRADAGRVEAQR